VTLRVSAVIPSLGDTALLEASLPPLAAELAGTGEIVLVDDTGRGVLESWAEEHHPEVRVVTRVANGGPAAALLDGVRVAEGELCFALHADVVVREGALEPLVQMLAVEEVFAVGPRVLEVEERDRPSAEETCASSVALRFEDGALHRVPRPTGPDPAEPRPLPFPPSCAWMVRREEFLERGGFDGIYAPFGWEEVDLGLDAWRSGRLVLEVPRAVVEHRRPGSIASRVPEELVRAAHEKNRLLALWKYIDDRGDAHDHLAALWRDALDAAIAGRREELVWLALALSELPRVDRSRRALGQGRRALAQILRVSDPAG